MGSRYLTSPRALALAALMLSACVAAVCEAQAHPRSAQNAVVRGDLRRLIADAEASLEAACPNPECRLAITPVSLLLWSPKTGRVRVTVSSVTRPASERSSDSPLLLYGRSSQRRKEDPYDATLVIYRDAGAHSLEVSVARHRSSRRALSRPILFTLPLAAELEGTSILRGRADIPSTFHRRDAICRLSQPPAAESTRSFGSGVGTRQSYDILFLATDFDSSFARVTGCGTRARCNSKIVGLVHRSSLLYEEPFGLVLRVARQYGPSSLGRTNDASTMLSNFVDRNAEERPGVIHDGKSSLRNQADLFQFFTGKSLNDEVFGLTYLSVACRNRFSDVAALVVQHVSDSLDPSIIAHHIGHTLSATHSPGGIMAPILAEPAPQEFEQQSREEIAAYLSDNYAACRGGKGQGSLPSTPTPTPTATPDPYAGVPQTLALRAFRPDAAHMRIIARVSEIRPGCSVFVRATGTRDAIRNGAVILEFAPTTLMTRVSRRLPAGIQQSGSEESAVYFQAEHVCPGAETIEVSRVLRMNPNAGGLAGKLVSKPRWLKLLEEAFSRAVVVPAS